MPTTLAARPATTEDLERAEGRLSLRVRTTMGRHAIADLAQSGCGRFLFPARAADQPLEAVIVNTGGGLTGGDRFSVGVDVGAGAAAVATTQACEKIYSAASGPARVSARLRLGPRARLSWIPQETILFEGSALDRSLEVDMAEDAHFLAAEALLLGRQARGERLGAARFRDGWRIRRGGRLVFAEEAAAGLRQGGWARLRGSKALLGEEVAALATIVLVSPEAEKRLDGARSIMEDCEVVGGASAFDGLVAMRMAAPSGLALRRALVRLIEWAEGAPPPRVWMT